VLLRRRSQLATQLRAAVLGSPPGEVCILRGVINKVRDCHEMDRLESGVPMPPFDLDRSRAVLEEAERLLTLTEFVNADAAPVEVAPPAAAAVAGHPSASSSSSTPIGSDAIDSLMDSVALSFRTENALTQVLFGVDVMPGEPSAAARPAPAEVWGMALRLAREAEELRQSIVQAAVALQAEREEQRRRAVRREVKRIRTVQRQVMDQVALFAVAQQAARGAHEARLRAKGLAAEILALADEAGRLRAAVDGFCREQADLLAQHTHQQRRRQFLALAPLFLPSAMFEPEMDCGMCLTTLDWEADQGIGFVTCCRGLGYVCGRCLAQPHSTDHAAVTELEIVRTVRGARRALGV
jgi:hypothetical protein